MTFFRMKINIAGCVNTLSAECMDFYHKYSGDGRNYTARKVYECYYDPKDPEFVVINFDPDSTLTLLILFITIPCGIMVLNCFYMCCCSRYNLPTVLAKLLPQRLLKQCKAMGICSTARWQP